MEIKKSCSSILQEIEAMCTSIDQNLWNEAYKMIDHAPRIFITAAGRSLLMMKSFGMRLMHLGYEIHFLDEVTCPAIKPDDVLLIASGSGETTGIIMKARKAQTLGAKIILWTQSPSSSLSLAADISLSFIKQTSTQPGASLFEQSLLIALDAFIQEMMKASDLNPSFVFQRHANLE